MKVKEWISYEEADDLPHSAGGMGGFFNWDCEGMRWKDYLERRVPEEHPYLEAIRENVLEHNLKFGGDYHQHSDEGVPLFEDGTVASFSYRAWGDLMAAIWSEHENIDYDYMDFYMNMTTRESKSKENDNDAIDTGIHKGVGREADPGVDTGDKGEYTIRKPGETGGDTDGLSA